ncbi:MAG: hypothetical protein ABIE94_01720 [archaeon]
MSRLVFFNDDDYVRFPQELEERVRKLCKRQGYAWVQGFSGGMIQEYSTGDLKLIPGGKNEVYPEWYYFADDKPPVSSQIHKVVPVRGLDPSFPDATMYFVVETIKVNPDDKASDWVKKQFRKDHCNPNYWSYADMPGGNPSLLFDSVVRAITGRGIYED